MRLWACGPLGMPFRVLQGPLERKQGARLYTLARQRVSNPDMARITERAPLDGEMQFQRWA